MQRQAAEHERAWAHKTKKIPQDSTIVCSRPSLVAAFDELVMSPFDRVVAERRAQKEKKKKRRQLESQDKKRAIDRLLDIHKQHGKVLPSDSPALEEETIPPRSKDAHETRAACRPQVKIQPMKPPPFYSAFRSWSTGALRSSGGEQTAWQESPKDDRGRRAEPHKRSFSMPNLHSESGGSSAKSFCRGSAAWTDSTATSHQELGQERHATAWAFAKGLATRLRVGIARKVTSRSCGFVQPTHENVPQVGRTKNADASKDSPQTRQTKSSVDVSIDVMDQELSATRSFPVEERQKIFRDLQRRYHPDKNLDSVETAKIVFQRLMDSRQSYLAAYSE